MSTGVSQSTGYGPNLQMSAFGWVMAIVLALMLLPVLPVVVLALILWKIFGEDEVIESQFETWRTASERQPNGS
ncbi:hypothetical protein EA462_01345 [Natrarchaeobius halalkaliphilus]|uniref:Uncharacterized protein n=1 Tax=Natrarchaeobius halalkaliphilus TaxID=1679091 RepID=A0A3N6LYF4_9EURY|nr:hypothetical protein [Natrarchaeobius halalkaliphilus]RQG92894.1 hypothetical protein EA462_01345 [Natrarchaeobius halalkaliphilus]